MSVQCRTEGESGRRAWLAPSYVPAVKQNGPKNTYVHLIVRINTVSKVREGKAAQPDELCIGSAVLWETLPDNSQRGAGY
jgi:hypothetical protein